MKCILIGMGCGPDHFTAEASGALGEAQLVIGAGRLLKQLPDTGAERITEYRPREIAELLHAHPVDTACVVYSGDSGFYSGAAGLLPLLEGMEVQVLPGISSVQTLASELGERWQDWNLCSAHGVSCDPVQAVMQGEKTFFLTSGGDTPGKLCTALTEAGLGELNVLVGENLGSAQTHIWRGTAQDCARRSFAPLNVMLAEAAPRYVRRTPGIPDDEFLRERVPMTKQEVRAAVLAKLGVMPTDVCWDIGAGTGSVSVELAQWAKSVWAVERKQDAAELIRKNRERFCAWNLHVVEGAAPDVLEELPKPDAVFVGGSGGKMEDILDAVFRKNPQARICVSAIALETIHRAVSGLDRLGYVPEVTQISVSRTKTAGGLHLLMAQNPVFLITGAQT